MANQYLAQCVQSRLANPAGSGNRTVDSKTADITDGVRTCLMSAEREAMLREDVRSPRAPGPSVYRTDALSLSYRGRCPTLRGLNGMMESATAETLEAEMGGYMREKYAGLGRDALVTALRSRMEKVVAPGTRRRKS